jgi:hypothetical protein
MNQMYNLHRSPKTKMTTTTTETTQLMTLFDNFILDSSKIVCPKKATVILIANIINHMLTDDYQTSTTKNIKSVFVSNDEEPKKKTKKPKAKKVDPVSTESSDLVLTEPDATASQEVEKKPKTKKTKKVEDPVSASPDVEKKPKAKKTKKVEDPVSTDPADPQEVEKKPKAKKVKKVDEPVSSDESSDPQEVEKKPKAKKVKKTVTDTVPVLPVDDEPVNEPTESESPIVVQDELVEEDLIEIEVDNEYE